MSQNYIFGYGSLMERASRQRTTPDIHTVYPVRVEGVQRGWWLRGVPIGYSTTFLGSRAVKGGVCYGVIYPVNDEELAATDRRESGYTRQSIPPEAITMLDGRATPPEGTVWFYAETRDITHVPDATFPIVQSYVDICLNGCLELEAEYPAARAADFARQFIRTTHDWNAYWVNDRLYPRRPFIYVPRAFDIDQLLHEELPALFAQIQLQPARW